jgi:glycosyltransferase involved in cell wall biosynthesis
MERPLVSIVVPIYKVEKYLERCLDSLVAQDYRPLEVILVNDGSPDGCGNIIRRYEARYPIFRSLWQENQGLSAARNNGIALATGKYIALVDSDDYVEPDFISSMVDLAEERQADIVMVNFYIDFPRGGIKIPFRMLTMHKYLSGEEAAQMSLALLRMPAYAWNKLYRRELFVEHNISYPSIYYEDVATTSRLLIKAERVAIQQKPVYHYCLRSTGITGSFGIKNVNDYLNAVDIIRHFIWDQNLWIAWKRPYRTFLRTVEAQLFLAITLQMNKLSVRSRQHLMRHVHHRINLLAQPPEPEAAEPELSLFSLPSRLFRKARSIRWIRSSKE